MSRTVKSNIYRVLKPCSNCPFVDDGKAIHLRDGRVAELKAYLLESDTHSFNCHKTVYNLDADMKQCKDEEQVVKMCAGAYNFLKKMNKPNIQMRLAKTLGVEDEDTDT